MVVGCTQGGFHLAWIAYHLAIGGLFDMRWALLDTLTVFVPYFKLTAPLGFGGTDHAELDGSSLIVFELSGNPNLYI
jgi:hypothetical protein